MDMGLSLTGPMLGGWSGRRFDAEKMQEIY
jgi:hypothetical protein